MDVSFARARPKQNKPNRRRLNKLNMKWKEGIKERKVWHGVHEGQGDVCVLVADCVFVVVCVGF